MTSVALVVLDTLRKDAFDRHFGWLPGRQFEQAYSTSHWTVPAHASLFTGRYPGDVTAHAKHLYFDQAEPVLAEVLRGAGYTTRALSANPNISGHFGFDRGFDEFGSPATLEPLNDDDVYDWRALGREAEGPLDYASGVAECVLGDSRTVRSLTALLSIARNWRNRGLFGVDSADWALNSIREIDFSEREFLFVNLMEAHQPYETPAAYRTVDPPEIVPAIGDLVMGELPQERTRRAYDDACRYLSDVYRRIFEELADAFDVVITLSDHGEMLGEQEAWGHEYGLYPQLTQVPLSIHGGDRSGTCESPVGLTDVYDTVLALAGIETDRDGQDLTKSVREREYRTEYHGLTPWSRTRLDDAGYATEAIEEYDRALFGHVAPDYYGYECTNGVRESGTPPGPTTLRERIAAIRREASRPGPTSTDVPDDVKTHLEHLGYR